MEISQTKLKELLVLPGHIKDDEFQSQAKKAKEENRSLWGFLVESGAVKDKEIGQLVAQDMGCLFIDLRDEKIDEATLTMIPEIMARGQGIIAFAQTAEEVRVGMVDPGDTFIKNVIAKRFGKAVKSFFITKEDLRLALNKYKIGLRESLRDKIAVFSTSVKHKGDQDKIIIDIVDLLLQYAQISRASDVHIEPQNNNVAVRFRVDSVMHEVITLSKILAGHITLRVKIMAKMRTDEHQSAQDGKFSFAINEESIDVRVSIVPVTAGENIVLRLLSASNRRLSINDLGLSDKNLSVIKEYIKHPNDMILSTGPTGSGKTSTLYGIIKVLNKKTVHIATIEDPVEYDIEGISQIQVNAKTNLNFAQGLRAIVRQDPDIIMVGEIRDEETAGIAINSAMTGHLVISTLHANDAATTIPRLLEMGIEPFLLSSTLKLIIAQRLVRKICPKCCSSYKISSKEIAAIKRNHELAKVLEKRRISDYNSLRLYRGAGCGVCANTGFSGRIGIFELLAVDDAIRELIIKEAPSVDINHQARKNGMATILEDGIDKVTQGVTTLNEVLRVTETG